MSDVLLDADSARWSHEFLSEVLANASWLQSPFNSPQLIADFGEDETLEIDFRVTVGGDGLLTEDRHRNVFEDVQYFLLLQTHPCVVGRAYLSPATKRERVIEGLYVVDHLLLNAHSTALARYGFSGIVSHQLKSMLVERASHPNVTEAIYKWTPLLTNLLKEKGKSLSQAELDDLEHRRPDVLETDMPQTDWSLDLSPGELRNARAWLFLNRLYAKSHNIDYRLAPATSALSEQLYRDTLWGHIPKTIFSELCLSPKESWHREYDGVPVKPGTLDDACGRKPFERYRHTLFSFQHLAQINRGIPESSLAEIATFDIEAAQALKDECTTGIAPFHYVQTVVRQAIEFYFSHNTTLLTSCSNVIRAAKKSGVSVRKFIKDNPIEPYLTRKARKLGIRYWSLNYQMSFIESNPNKVETHREKSEYFSRFRQNEGLLELIRALYGAMQIIVGWFMALRVGEMIDLNVSSLSDNNRWLSVKTRKSGPGTFRRTDTLPCPPLVARIIRRTLHFRRILSGCGVRVHEALFSVPDLAGDRLTVSSKSYNARIDCFIDYINAPVVSDGLRHYIRQHQLRKNFALWYYAESPFEKTDTLQWYLRQRDSEQTEHYLRANFSGQVLRNLQSVAATMMVRDGRSVADNLAAAVLRRFGVERYSLIDERAFTEYSRLIERLQQDGTVAFDTHHLTDSSGKTLVVSLVVFDEEDEDGDDE